MEKGELAGHLIGASSAFAGLILVFLGIVFTGYEGYEATEQKAVASRFRQRAVLALVGFFACLLSTGFGIAAIWPAQSALVWASLVFFAIAFVAVVIAAIACVRDLFR